MRHGLIQSLMVNDLAVSERKGTGKKILYDEVLFSSPYSSIKLRSSVAPWRPLGIVHGQAQLQEIDRVLHPELEAIQT